MLIEVSLAFPVIFETALKEVNKKGYLIFTQKQRLITNTMAVILWLPREMWFIFFTGLYV